jgi:hypothetical protein
LAAQVGIEQKSISLIENPTIRVLEQITIALVEFTVDLDPRRVPSQRGDRTRSADQDNNRRTFYRDYILQAVLGGLLDHLKSHEAMKIFVQEHNAASERRLVEIGPSRGKAERRINVLETEIKRLVDQLAKGISVQNGGAVNVGQSPVVVSLC